MLHSHGILEREELERASALGLDLLDGEESAFSLPCPRFAGCCTIYRDRPSACRRFRCALLRKLEERKIELAEALSIVREARRLADEAMPGATAEESARRFRANLQPIQEGPEQSDRSNSPERLRFIALGLYLDRHFVLARDGHFYTLQPVADSSS